MWGGEESSVGSECKWGSARASEEQCARDHGTSGTGEAHLLWETQPSRGRHSSHARPHTHPPSPQLLFGEKLYTEGNGSLTFVDYLSTIGAKGPPGHGGGDGKPPRLARSGGAGVEKD